MQESLWRIGAGVTAFRVRDPDPCAVDGGSVLGIRFEIMRSGRFLQPYVVLLNRPYGTDSHSETEGNSTAKTYLRVHRHTIPNCIPLGGLAARYLPPPAHAEAGNEEAPAKRRSQDLSLFVRELRQRLVAYHNRLGAVADMRRAAGLNAEEKKRQRRKLSGEQGAGRERMSSGKDEGQEEDEGVEGPPRIVEVSLADAEAKQIKIDWSNGDVCRLVMSDGGEIEKCVMYGAQGRDMPAAREFLQRVTRVERLPKSIQRKRGLEPA
jgi:central kinetochore subunit Mal2/MCM21